MSELVQRQTGTASVEANPSVPPLNSMRFAKSNRDILLGCARKWFGIDSALAMSLNVARLRGMDGFVEELASGLQQASLAQAFYLYRSGGRMQQALELAAGPITALVRANMPLPGLVIDAVVETKMHDRALYQTLLRKIVGAKPDLTMSPTTHAFLHYEALATLDKYEAEVLNAKPSPDGTFDDDIRIAGLVTVRNESEIISEYIGRMLGYCDFIIILGERDDDQGPEKALAEFGAERIEIIRIPDMPVFDSKLACDTLFARARTREATHFIMVDADEILGPALANASALREQARQLRRGEVLTVRWPQVFGEGLIDYGRFAGFNDLSRLLPPWKDLLYCDDGKALHRRMPIHNPWLPEGFPLRRRFMNDVDAWLVHFEKANPVNALIKTDYYIAKELLVYKTPLPTILSRYLSPHLINNILWDAPPAPNPMAVPPIDAYARLVEPPLNDTKALASQIPLDMRFLFNLDYWS